MLGRHIRELREKNAISLNELAEKSGFSEDELLTVETENVSHLDPQQLMKIAENLCLKSAYDFIYLMRLNKEYPRRFRAYNVSLPRTGTTSIAKMFSNYNSQHEFLKNHVAIMIEKLEKNVISKEQFRDFVIKRDRTGCLEMDSAFFNQYYIDILAEEFSSAKFIFVVRDCFSWVDSVVNLVLLPEIQSNMTAGLPSFGLPFDLPGGMSEEKDDFRCNFKDYIGGMLSCWASLTENTLKKLPLDRSLILRTHELFKKTDILAEFVGVPSHTLNSNRSNKSRQKLHLLHSIDYNFLKAESNKYCSAMMDKFFPNYSLKDFLSGRYPSD